MTDRHDLTINEASQAWDELADKVDALINAWESSEEPPRLEPHLTDGSPAFRQMLLVELIKVDLEYRWQNKETYKLVEHYVAEFPELIDDGRIPADLIYEEFHIRQQSGDTVDPHEYRDRFPKQADELERLLGIEDPYKSTALFTAEVAEEIAVGEQFDDFDLLATLGRGAFAKVYLARQRSMQRTVALKISADQGDEPQTLAQLDHDGIVRVFDQRVIPEQKLRLLYMQHVPGGTLHSVHQSVAGRPVESRIGRDILDSIDESLEQCGQSPPADSPFRLRLLHSSWPEAVCLIGSRLAEALDYAHRQDVLHRDIKPANVLLDADGTPKLADFNVSFSSKVEGATPAAFFGGSLVYMSLEQIEASNPREERSPDSIDGRSDIYSLGVLLWEMLTGERPFGDDAVSESWAVTLDRMAEQRRRGVSRAVADRLPLGLGEVLRKSLEPDVQQRYQSAAEFGRQLELCLQPHTKRLLESPRYGWKRVACRYPILIILMAVFVPNIFAGIFNYFYNENEIILRLDNAGAHGVFETVQTVINAIAFPAGFMVAVVLAWPIAQGLKRWRDEEFLGKHELQQLRKKSLNISLQVAAVSLAEWLIAGIAYPLAIGLATDALTPALFIHFLVSLLLCGLIATAYPFLGVTFVAARAFYPAFFRLDSIGSEDLPALVRFGRRTIFFLALAAAVPLLALTALILIQSTYQIGLTILSAGGVLGFIAAFCMFRPIQDDLGRLASAMIDKHPNVGETIDSNSTFWLTRHR